MTPRLVETLKRLWPMVSLLAVSACATLQPDAAFAPVDTAAQKHLEHPVVWQREDDQRLEARQRVADLLGKPLSMDMAVQVALLNNRGLQARIAELGIADAERVQAGILPNPGFSLARTIMADETEIERGIHVNLLRLLVLPVAQDIAGTQLRLRQAQTIEAVMSLAAQTRKAWVQAVAAQASEQYAQQVLDASQASAELARRMASVGNFSRLQQAREQVFYADAATRLASARQVSMVTRERLARLMGLWGESLRFELPMRLPDLPAAPREASELEQIAIAQRYDVQAARMTVELTARSLGLTRATRLVNVLEVGGERMRASGGDASRTWDIRFELPLFDWGQARVARAEAIYMQAMDRAAQMAIEARSEVREAWGVYRSAWDIAQHHLLEVVPLRKRIAEENLLRYNGMFIGVFELLADARAQIASVDAALSALRDFWLAQADLDMAMLGRAQLPLPVVPAMPGAVVQGVGHPH